MELYAVEFANFVISNRNILFFIDETSSPGHIASSKNHAKSDGVTSFVLNLMVTVLEKNDSSLVSFTMTGNDRTFTCKRSVNKGRKFGFGFVQRNVTHVSL